MASVRKREWTSPNGEKKTAWVVNYTDQSGKRRLKTFEQKKLADRHRLQVESEIESGTHVAASQTATVRKICDLFLKHQEDRQRDGRIGRSRHLALRYSVDRSIVPFMGARKLTEVRTANIDALYQHMIRVGRLSPVTARERVSVFKLVEEFAIKRGFLKVGVALQAGKELRGIVQKRIRIFSQEDVALLLSTVRIRKQRGQERVRFWLECTVHLAAFCGLRFGEIAGLQTNNIDFSKRVIHVRNNMTRWDQLKGPKTRAGIRDVPMPPHLAEMLHEWLRLHFVPNERNLVFVTKHGTYMAADNFHQSFWKPLLKAAGLTKNEEGWHHFHALRHFMASWLIHKKFPVTEVAELLGHSSFDETLQTYSHALIGGRERQEAVDRVSLELLALPPAMSPTRQASDTPL